MRADALSLATISEDGLYRYTLSRTWGRERPLRRTLFVMLNPSIADAEQDDRTIRRCTSFATREGCGGLDVVNLYAYRTAYPRQLHAAQVAGVDIVGPANDAAIRELAIYAHRIVAAWGAHPIAAARVPAVLDLLAGRELTCLGTTNTGAPRHPLYLAGTTPLIAWRPSS